MNTKHLYRLAEDVREGRISRRTFVRRALALGLSLPATTAVLAACATPAPTSPAPAEKATTAPIAVSTATSTAPSTSAPKLPEALNVLLFSHDADIHQKKGPAFESQYNVKLSFETVVADDHRDKIISAHRAGTSAWDTLPLWANVVQEMAQRGWLVDLTEHVESTLLKSVDDLVSGSSLFQAATYQGRIYAIPDKVGGPILQWNKELLQKRGLDPERPAEWHKTPNSIDEFVQWAKECTFEEGGVKYWGFTDSWGDQVYSTFSILIQMFGGNVFDMSKNEPYGEPTMDSEEGIAALQWMVDLLHKHQCIDPASLTYNWVFDFTPGYLGGRTAFIITWPFVTHTAEDATQSAIVGKNGFAPNFAAKTSATVEGTEFQAISAYAPHGADAARLWLEHMSSQPMMRLQGLESAWSPIYKSLLNDPEITKAMFEGPAVAQSLDYPHDGYFTPDSTLWGEILRDHIHAALRQEVSPQAALQAAVQDIKASRTS